MGRSKKRRMRILLVAGGVVVLGAAAATAYSIRQWRLDERATEARAAGRAAIEAGDYARALDGIGLFLQRYTDRGDTAEDHLLYARARRRIEQVNGKHLVTAIAHLRRALRLDPQCKPAQDEL